jgi:hypothetical protein
MKSGCVSSSVRSRLAGDPCFPKPTIHRLEPDRCGKLVIDLMPVHKYAELTGLEVVDESK